MRWRLRGVLLRAAMVIVGILAALVVVEVSLRERFISDRMVEPDPDLGLRLVPGGEFDFPIEGSRVHLRFNSLGFHDREHAFAKPPGVFRIVILGDSFMNGLQVPYPETFASRLELALAARGVPAEVINLGVQSYNTHQEYFALEKYGLRFQPDLVLLAFFINDVTGNVEPLQGRVPYTHWVMAPDGRLQKADGRPSLALNPVFGLLRKTFPATYAFTFYALTPSRQSPANVSAFDALRPDESETVREGWNLTLAILRQLRNRTEESGAKLFLFSIPPRGVVHPDLLAARDIADNPVLRTFLAGNSTEPIRILQGFSRAENVSYLPLDPGLKDYANRSGEYLYFRETDAHWNSLGNKVAASLVAKRLIEEGLVPSPTAS